MSNRAERKAARRRKRLDARVDRPTPVRNVVKVKVAHAASCPASMDGPCCCGANATVGALGWRKAPMRSYGSTFIRRQTAPEPEEPQSPPGKPRTSFPGGEG